MRDLVTLLDVEIDATERQIAALRDARATYRLETARPQTARKRRRRRLTDEQRAAISQRMKAIWAGRAA